MILARLARLAAYAFALATGIMFYADIRWPGPGLPGTPDMAKYGLPLSVVLFLALYYQGKCSK